MRESGAYPPGAEFDSNAPFNQEDPKPIKVNVTVSITLSKTVTVEVDDYIKECEDGYISYDTSECDLKKAVKEQLVLPYEAHYYVENSILKKQLSGWEVDELEIVKE